MADAVIQIRRTVTPNGAPAAGSLVPGALSVEMATQPMPRLWVGTDPALAFPGNRRLVVDPNTLGGRAISTTAPTNGQVLAWNAGASQWEAAGVGVGTVTSITAGNGLATTPAGGITGTGSIGLTIPVSIANGGTNATDAAGARTQLGITQANLGGPFLALTGGALSGPLTLAGDATAALGAVTLQQMEAASKGTPIFTGDDPPPSPQPGDLWFDTIAHVLKVWNGSTWVVSAAPVTGFLPLTGGTVTGNAFFLGTRTAIMNLDLGVSQLNRVGFWDGNNGNLWAAGGFGVSGEDPATAGLAYSNNLSFWVQKNTVSCAGFGSPTISLFNWSGGVPYGMWHHLNRYGFGIVSALTYGPHQTFMEFDAAGTMYAYGNIASTGFMSANVLYLPAGSTSASYAIGLDGVNRNANFYADMYLDGHFSSTGNISIAGFVASNNLYLPAGSTGLSYSIGLDGVNRQSNFYSSVFVDGSYGGLNVNGGITASSILMPYNATPTNYRIGFDGVNDVVSIFSTVTLQNDFTIHRPGGNNSFITSAVTGAASWAFGTRNDGMMMLARDQLLGLDRVWVDTGGILNAANGVNVGGGQTMFMGGGAFPTPDNAWRCGTANYAWQWVSSYGWDTQSDARLKRDIQAPPPGALAKVMQLQPVDFRWRGRDEAGLHRGFLAGDVCRVMGEEFGGWHKDEATSLEGLDYNELLAVLWQAVRELAAERRNNGRNRRSR